MSSHVAMYVYTVLTINVCLINDTIDSIVLNTLYAFCLTIVTVNVYVMNEDWCTELTVLVKTVYMFAITVLVAIVCIMCHVYYFLDSYATML